MIKDYETTKQAAKRIGIDESRIRRLCIDGRIPGAAKIGRAWLIPKDSWPVQAGYGPPPNWNVKEN